MAALPALARADPPAPPAALVTLMAQPDHKAALLSAGERAMAGLPDPCPSAEWHTTGDVGLLTMPVLDPAGRAIAGSWREQLVATGCGGARAFNVLTAVQPDGTLTTEPLLPGSTIANPVLQHDSMGYAAAAFGGLPPGCEKGLVTDTTFVAFDGEPDPQAAPDRMSRPWHETWTLWACGKVAQVTMRFVPDATGTTIAARPLTDSNQ